MKRASNPITALLTLGLLLGPITGCARRPVEYRTVTFKVLVKNRVPGAKIFLAGDDSLLGAWNPAGVLMNKESDSVWTKTLSFPEGKKLEYKVTEGSWWTQALDSAESKYDNFRLTVHGDTTVQVTAYGWLNRMADGIPILDANRFRPRRPYLELDSLWRYHAGDSSIWSDPQFNDNGWVVTDPFIIWSDSTQPSWRGIGWFRFHMIVDSSLWNRTLAIRINQLGASEVYYNGRLLYRFGRVGATSATYESNAMSWWQQIRIDPQFDQLFAVRYANPDWKSLVRMGYAPGFLITLKDVNTAFRTAIEVRVNAEVQMVFTLIPLILFFVHLSLYGFLRSQRQNLYYALCMLGFAGLTYFSYERDLVVEVGKLLLFMRLGGISVSLAILFGVLTVFELNYGALPKRTWAYVGMAAVTGLLLLMEYKLTIVTAWNYIFFGATALEGILISFRKRNKGLHGDWLILVGFLMLTGFIVFQMLVDYGIAPQTFWTRQSYAYGMVSLAISMSVFLSYNFARVNKDLEVQLNNVRELSAKAIEQERTATKLELESRLVEAENKRRGEELQSARELQLSLLPRKLPQIEGFDIACLMKTATEVGGDYYDFLDAGNGSVTAVIGDATGHGLKAGNMVTATKGLLSILSTTRELDAILASASRAIKRMNMHLLTMCLAIVRISRHRLTFSSAGMPPLVLWRSESRKTEFLVQKAMPLGAVDDFPYVEKTIPVQPGDIVLMVSDGLMEMFNGEGDTFGMDNIAATLAKNSARSAREIAESLFSEGARWADGRAQPDDMTVIVVRIVE